MMDLFTQLHQQGMTIILVTHDMELVLKYASQVIVMEQGKVTSQSTPQSLFYGKNQSENFIKPPLVHLIEKLRKKGKTISEKQERSLADFVQGWKGSQ